MSRHEGKFTERAYIESLISNDIFTWYGFHHVEILTWREMTKAMYKSILV